LSAKWLRLKSDPYVNICPESSVVAILTCTSTTFYCSEKASRITQKQMSPFSLKNMGDALLALGMGVTRDREKGTVTIIQKNYTKLLEWYGKAICNPTRTPGAKKSCRWTSRRRGF